MFPEFSPQLPSAQTTESPSFGKTFLFDFQAGDFIVKDGKLTKADGIDALKVWIEKVIKTAKFKFKIYDNDTTNQYGTTLLELVSSGHPQIFIQAEIQRELTDVLSQNPFILSVKGFTFTRERRTLVVGVELDTEYGTVAQEVII